MADRAESYAMDAESYRVPVDPAHPVASILDDLRSSTGRNKTVDVAELQRLHEAATPAPWAWEATGEKDNSWALGVVEDEDGNLIAGCNPTGENEVIEPVCEAIDGNHADAALIVAMRNALPELLSLFGSAFAPEPPAETRRAAVAESSREDIRTVLAAILEDDCTTTAFLAAEDRLVALLDADPREVIFCGEVADWENPSPDSGDWPKAILDGQWLADPAQTTGRVVQVFAAAPQEQAGG